MRQLNRKADSERVESAMKEVQRVFIQKIPDKDKLKSIAERYRVSYKLLVSIGGWRIN